MSRRFRLLALSALSACYAPPNHRAPNGADAPVGGLDSGPALGGTDSAHPVEDERDDTMDDEVEQIGGGGPHAGDGSVLALDDGPCGQPIDRLHAQAEGAAFFYEERPQGPRIFPLCLSLDAAALAALEEAPRDVQGQAFVRVYVYPMRPARGSLSSFHHEKQPTVVVTQ